MVFGIIAKQAILSHVLIGCVLLIIELLDWNNQNYLLCYKHIVYSIVSFWRTIPETKGGYGNNSTNLFNYASSSGSRTTASRTAQFTTSKACVVYGSIWCDWQIFSPSVTINGSSLTMQSSPGSRTQTVFMWILPNPGSYSITLSGSVVDGYGLAAGYTLIG